MNDPNWIGFCQKRRFWIKKESLNKNVDNSNYLDHFLDGASEEWNNYESIICNPINVNKVKKIKMLKRGFKSLARDPLIFFDEKKQSLKFHFDMHHGYGNLSKAANLLEKNIGVLMPDAFIIGRQVMTGHGLWIDLLALDKDGDLVIIELKKAKTRYKVVDQIWHYFTWIKKQSYDEINDIAKKKHLQDYHSIDQKFNDYFKRSPDKWNSHQKLIIVGEKIDEETKEIASTIKESGENITCIELNVYDNSPEKIVVIRHVPL